MTGEFSTRVEGADALASSLAHVGHELGDLDAAGQVAGQAIRQRAQSAAPVDTGALVRSIYANAADNTVTVGAAVPYAAFQEFGTVYVPASPYLRPALDAATGQIVDAYTGEIDNLLDGVRGA